MKSSQGTGQTLVGLSANVGAGKCSSCHRAHTAKAEYLLMQAQPELCYTCHGNGGANTQVKNGVRKGTAGGALRGGGFETALIDSSKPTKDLGAATPYGFVTTNQKIPALVTGQATTSRHEINGASGTAWGNGPISGTENLGKTLTLACGSCHDPHGNGNYRILRAVPVGADSAAVPDDLTTTTVDESKPAIVVDKVNIPDTLGSPYVTTNYWLSGDATVPLSDAVNGGTVTALTNGTSSVGTLANAPDGYIQNVAAWCTTCHTRYLAPSGSYKTASGDATFSFRHRSNANYKQGAANCITCHVSHGSNASMAGNDGGAVAAPGAAGALLAADSRLLRVDNRGTCVMCHDK